LGFTTYLHGCTCRIKRETIEEVPQMKVTVKFTPRPLYLQENGPPYPLSRTIGGLTRRQECFYSRGFSCPSGYQTTIPRWSSPQPSH